MRRRVWAALVVGSFLAACNAITNIGDYTFDGDAGGGRDASPSDGNTTGDAGAETTDADASNDADAGASSPDADASPVDAATPDADAAPCRVPSPNTTTRLMECGSTTCDLDKTSPPQHCCVAPDASAACVERGTCAQGNFSWECTRAFQCPFPSACCLTIKNLKPTCPPTAEALQSRCNLDDDGGPPVPCNLDLELCTGNETCRKPGTTCMELDIVGTGARPIGACL